MRLNKNLDVSQIFFGGFKWCFKETFRCFNKIFGVKRYLNEIFLLKQYSNKMKSLKVHLQPFSSINLIHFLEWNVEEFARTYRLKQSKTSEATEQNETLTEWNWVSLNGTEQRRSCLNSTKLKQNEAKGMLNKTRCQWSNFPQNLSLNHAWYMILAHSRGVTATTPSKWSNVYSKNIHHKYK